MLHCVCLQIYRILGKTVVCYPIVFDLSDFYLSQDVMLLIDDIKVSQALLCTSDSAEKTFSFSLMLM